MKIKIVYLTVVLINIIIGVTCFSKYESSDSTYIVKPGIVDMKKLAKEKAETLGGINRIRKTTQTIFICSSVLVAVFSVILLKYDLFRPKLIIKVILGLSIVSAIVFVVANRFNVILGPVPSVRITYGNTTV